MHPNHEARLSEVTAILHAAAEEDLPREALAERLVPILYDELRRIARSQRRRHESGGLQTTALVHEAYLRLAGRALVPDRAYVFAAAAKAMRDVLVDHARRRGAAKRGSGETPLTLSTLRDVSDGADLDTLAAHVLDVDAALRRLEAVSPRAAQIVECRFFGELSVEEAAEALGISPATAKREWRVARAWLHRALGDGEPEPARSAKGGAPSSPAPDAD